MNRRLNPALRGPTPLAFPAAQGEAATWTSPWVRLLPLWRHGVWLTVLFAVSAMAVSIRLDVHQLQRDLDRNARMHREARVLHERLELEWAVRRRTAAVEAMAGGLGLGAEAPVSRTRAP